MECNAIPTTELEGSEQEINLRINLSGALESPLPNKRKLFYFMQLTEQRLINHLRGEVLKLVEAKTKIEDETKYRDYLIDSSLHVSINKFDEHRGQVLAIYSCSQSSISFQLVDFTSHCSHSNVVVNQHETQPGNCKCLEHENCISFYSHFTADKMCLCLTSDNRLIGDIDNEIEWGRKRLEEKRNN